VNETDSAPVADDGYVAIVNDDPIQLVVLGGLVGKMGLRAACFSGAEEALEGMSQAGTPLLVVTDLYMPSIDGWRFCRLLRSEEFAAFNQVPILVVSATFAGDEPQRIASDLGAEAFLPCPVDGEAFIETIRIMLDGQVVRNRPHVLIVDDDAGVAGVLAHGFRSHGYRVTEASTCQSARDAFRSEKVDVALLDINLPDGTGTELLNQFYAVDGCCVFIMMSGAPNPDAYLSWMKSGASASLQKPFDSAYLLEVCAKARRERALLRVEHLLELRTHELQVQEKERAKLQARLIQAQKMETVGRLAGGVAHDFNNMLGVILGNTELAMDFVDAADPLFDNLKEVRNAAVRSADITRQLLAFSRKQAVAPISIDLNAQLDGMLKMLRRLVTEDITIHWTGGVNVWAVRIDPCQVDQLLANLCVNARDAIKTSAGYIAIKTENVTLDHRFCDDHEGSVPGQYVCLSVCDNGEGMEAEVLEHAFEPFFTTKEVGHGTGLGLATVYGIVKQNHGYVSIDSKPGEGTQVRIYLPRELEAVVEAKPEVELPASCGHGETVLVVEDEPAILQLTTLLLKRQRYNVLAAPGPADAIRLAREHEAPIHLLLTDVIMPEMNGRGLESELRRLHPQLKSIFMSGYTSDIISRQGLVDDDMHFIQKPFSARELANKVLDVLALDPAPVPVRNVPLQALSDAGDRGSADDAQGEGVPPRDAASDGNTEHLRISRQLQQQHKIESTGRLARGIAHECNNLIMVIQWYAERALEFITPEHPARQWLGKIMSAAGESAELTRQMLSRQMIEFARNQAVYPEIIGLSAVAGSLKLLDRLVHDSICITLDAEPEVWPVWIDPGQMDQILFNLCLNAQDAIGESGGEIKIEIANDRGGEWLSARVPDFKAGDYVRLRVRDNGCGMKDSVIARLFDPFFTTKVDGAGLGLTTVLGIARQNGGYVLAASEEGHGSVFDVYLPRYIADGGRIESASR
jgi:signal transduction histidine kinase